MLHASLQRWPAEQTELHTTALVRGPTPTECPVLRPAAAPQQVLVPPSLIQTLPTVGGIFSQDGTWD